MFRLNELIQFRGRLARLRFWKWQLFLMLMAALDLILGYSAIMVVGSVGAVLLLPMVTMIVGALAIYVRRLHDRNRSAWWIVPFVAVPTVASGWAMELDPTLASPVTLLVAFSSLGLQVWGWVDVGFLRGTGGQNQFGPDPSALPSVEVFA